MTFGKPRYNLTEKGYAQFGVVRRVMYSFCRIMPIFIVALLLVPIFLTGCQDEVQRYKTLSFFFDGVPVPEGYDPPNKNEELIGPWGVSIPADSDLGRQMLAQRDAWPEQQSTQVAEEVFFYHTPYQNRDCFGCHNEEQGYTPPTTGAELCSKCHESYIEFEQDDGVHGPVVVGKCGWCHEAHKSEYPSLTKEDQPDLCMTCHDPYFIESDQFHAGLEDKRCSRCHDPHASGNRLLLADSRTYERRQATFALLPSPHAGWPKDLCSKCHIPEQSNALTEDVDSTCMSCHDEYTADNPETPHIHEAVTQGKCTTCHMPHRSTMPKLIRADAEKMCYQCHKPQELQNGTHPNVTRVDCLICHNGHSSPRPSLLKPDIPGGAQQAKAGVEP